MKKEPTIILKEIIYTETGKSITELIKESFFNFYFAKNNKNDAENTCYLR